MSAWEVHYRYAGAERKSGTVATRDDAYSFALRIARRAQRERLDVDLIVKDTATGDAHPYFVGHAEPTHVSRLEADARAVVSSPAHNTSNEGHSMDAQNVVSIKGGKVHSMAPDGDLFPLCRSGAQSGAGTQYKATSAALTCKTCIMYAERLSAKAAAEVADVTPELTDDQEDKGETVPMNEEPAQANEDAAQAVSHEPDTDEMISNVHATIDVLLLATDVPAVEGCAEAAEDVIKTLPPKHRAALRKAVSDAKAKRTAELTPKVPARADVAEDFAQYAGVPELIRDGVKLFSDGMTLGRQLGNVGEKIAHTMIAMRQRIIDPETGLPDLMAERKTTRNAASEVYQQAKRAIAEDDVDAQSAHNSLIRATQNKTADVLVEWLRSFDGPDREETLKVMGDLFPGAVDKVSEDTSPSQAIRALYAEKGVILPRYGRTELARINRRVKALEAAETELEALTDATHPEAEAQRQEVAAKIEELKEEIPVEVLADRSAQTEKTPADRTSDALAQVRDDLKRAGKRYAKVQSAADRAKAKAEVYKIIRDAADAFDLDLSALVPTDNE